MTRREIAELSCKILALWEFSQAVFTMSGLILFSASLYISITGHDRSNWNDVAYNFVLALVTLGPLVLGIFLWRRAAWLAEKMIPVEATDQTVSLDYESVMSIAFSAIGVWTLIPSLRDLLVQCTVSLGSKYQFIDYWRSNPWQSKFWSAILGVAFALWLIFGSPGITRIILALRRTDPVAPTEEDTFPD